MLPRAAGLRLWCGRLLHDVSSFAARVTTRGVRSPERIRRLTHVSTLFGITSYPLWSQLLHFPARRTQSALVADLRTLRSVIEALGGSNAIAETAREIYEIGDWW